MKRVSMPFGRSTGYKPEHPERTARKVGKAWDSQVTYQTWPNREAMARSIRMQQTRAPKPDDWKACVPLSDIEGFYKAPQRASDTEIQDRLRNEITNTGDC